MCREGDETITLAPFYILNIRKCLQCPCVGVSLGHPNCDGILDIVFIMHLINTVLYSVSEIPALTTFQACTTVKPQVLISNSAVYRFAVSDSFGYTNGSKFLEYFHLTYIIIGWWGYTYGSAGCSVYSVGIYEHATCGPNYEVMVK